MFKPGFVRIFFEGEGGGPGGGGDDPGNLPGGDTWYGSFSEDNQAIVNKNGWVDKGPETVVQAYGELHALLGNRDMDGYLKLPEGDDKWDDVWNKLGRPEDISGYPTVQPPEDHLENDPTAAWLAKVAHGAGLTAKQYETILTGYYEDFTKQVQTQKEADYEKEVQAGETKMREEWGAKFGENYAIGNAAVKAFGITEDEMAGLQEILGTFRVGQLMLEMGRYVVSDSGPTVNLPGLDQQGAGRGATWAQQEMDTLRADKEFMAAVANQTFTDPKWSGHVERWNAANAVLQREKGAAMNVHQFGA